MARALSVDDILKYSPKVYEFEGDWKRSIGIPERGFSIIIWGDSSNGKTRFALKLCKYLATFDRLVYNSLEEGKSKTIKEAFEALNMREVNGRFTLLDKEPIAEMRERLAKRNSAKVVAIDSVQYSGINYEDYIDLRSDSSRKTLVVVSHADGKYPAGAVARSIMYNADVKVFVQGHRAFIKSRFGGGRPFDVWPEEAERIHGPIAN